MKPSAHLAVPNLDFAHIELRTGDVLFISVPDAFWARLASRWSLPKYKHGHVGIVVRGGRSPLVVHASGNPIAINAKVIRVPLREFAQGARRLDVFRPRDEEAASRAARVASGFVDRNVPFDDSFSLASRDRLYCTELVWRALSEGSGRDIVPHKHRVGGREVVTLSDLETALDLSSVRTAITP